MIAIEFSKSSTESRPISTETNITILLEQASEGNREAADELFRVVYDELRRIAATQVKGEPAGITLDSTAIVHEVWIKLIGKQHEPNWENRRHFFAAAAQAMRRILVDAARARKRQKRGGGRAKLELREDDLSSTHDDDLLALHEALEQLQQVDERKAHLVMLRYFAGMTNAQAAESLGISVATAERDWTYARAWLRSKMEG